LTPVTNAALIDPFAEIERLLRREIASSCASRAETAEARCGSRRPDADAEPARVLSPQ
jgi:hypothetical protein